MRQLERLARRLAKPGEDWLFLDLHQDDRYRTDELYVLAHSDARSSRLARIALEAVPELSPILGEIDGVPSEGGVLPKSYDEYPGSFSAPPELSSAAHLVLEINDARGFLPALRAILTSR